MYILYTQLVYRMKLTGVLYKIWYQRENKIPATGLKMATFRWLIHFPNLWTVATATAQVVQILFVQDHPNIAGRVALAGFKTYI